MVTRHTVARRGSPLIGASALRVRNTGFMLIVGLVMLAAITLPLPVFTGLGAHRRGLAIPLAVMAGLFFSVTWTVWYLWDEHPYRPAHRHAA